METKHERIMYIVNLLRAAAQRYREGWAFLIASLRSAPAGAWEW